MAEKYESQPNVGEIKFEKLFLFKTFCKKNTMPLLN